MKTKRTTRGDFLGFLKLARSGEIDGFLSVLGESKHLVQGILKNTERHLRKVGFVRRITLVIILIIAVITLYDNNKNHVPGYFNLAIISDAICLAVAVYLYQGTEGMPWTENAIEYWRKFRAMFSPSWQALVSEQLLRQRVHEHLLSLKWATMVCAEDEAWRSADKRFHEAYVIAQEKGLAATEDQYELATQGHWRTPSTHDMYLVLLGIIEGKGAKP